MADGIVRPTLVVDGQSVVVTQQAPVAQYLAAATFLQPGCQALAAPTRVWRSQVCNDINTYSTDKNWGHNLQIMNDFGDFKMKFTGGHREWRNVPISDLDGIGAFRGPQFTNASLFNGFPTALLQNLGFDAKNPGTAADGVNLYARAATGFRSGGFNSGDPVLSGTTTLASFKGESLTSYEVGLKSELFDRKLRLNLAAYYNTYNNLAVSIPQANSGTGTFTTRVANAGKVDYTGIEAEFQAVLTQNFSVDGSIGYVKTKYKEFLAGQPVTGTTPVNIASIVTPGYTSPFTANLALNGQFPLNWKDAKLTARIGFTHEDGKYAFNNAISAPFNEAIKGDPRDTVDVQIGIEKMPLAGTEADIRFWGKNITNQHSLVRGIDFGALGYAGGYFADPATYGVTFGVKF